jgi:hypothetical protein
MIGDGPALYDRPRAAVKSSTRLQDRSVLLESADIRSERYCWAHISSTFYRTLLEQQTVLCDRFVALPLQLSSYFKYILLYTAGTTDSLARPFYCANFTVGHIFQVYIYRVLLEQQTVLHTGFLAQPLLLGSYFKYTLPCTAGTTDSLAHRFSCATVTVGFIFQVHFTMHCWNNRQSCTAVFLRNRFLAQAPIRD